MSPDALSAITGIPAQSVREYLAAEHLPGMVAAPTELPHTQTAQLAMLSVPLTEGLGEDDDVRLRALVETLTLHDQLTYENIARLIDTDAADVEAVVVDAAKVDARKKYRIALRVSYLLAAIGNAERFAD